MATTYESVRAELYGLLPDAFVSARNDAERVARRAGDRDTANAIKALGRPTVVAWLANQLVRTHHDELVPLLELGAALREATRALSGEQLRSLSQQQHQVIMALVRQARSLASAAGQQVTEETATGLEETLRAALADEELAAQLAAGHLSAGLQHVGFGLIGGTATGPADSAQPRTATRPSRGKTPEREAKRAEAEAEERAAALQLAEARVSAARTATEHAFDVERQARSAQDDTAAAARTAAEEVETLREQLESAEASRSEADAEAALAAAAYETAARDLTQARDALTHAESEADVRRHDR